MSVIVCVLDGEITQLTFVILGIRYSIRRRGSSRPRSLHETHAQTGGRRRILPPLHATVDDQLPADARRAGPPGRFTKVRHPSPVVPLPQHSPRVRRARPRRVRPGRRLALVDAHAGAAPRGL